MRRLLLFFLITFLADYPSSPLHAQYSIRHFTTKDGLSQGSVYYFLEDSRGYVWMSSQNGLNRLEGSHFRNYIHSDRDPGSIGKGEVRGLVEAPSGDVWAGTEVCLSRYVRRTGRFQNYYQIDSQGRQQLTQNLPFFADDSTVWFLNSRRGVVRYNYRSGRQTIVLADVPYRFSSDTREAVMDIPNGQLWLRLPIGLLRYDLATHERYYYFTAQTNDQVGQERVIHALCPGSNSSLWLSTNKGICQLTQHGYRDYHVGINPEDDVIYALTQDPNGSLWIGTSRSGILVMNCPTGHITHRFRHSPFRSNSLTDDHINELFVDRRGRIWANADPIGIDLIYPTMTKPAFVDDDLLDSTDFNGHGVRGIARDQQGYLWVGTVGQGIRRLDLRTGNIKRYAVDAGLQHYGVRTAFCSSTGKLLVGGNGGLSFWNAGQQRFLTLKIPSKNDPANANTVRSLLELTPDLFLIATNAGLYTVDRQKQFRCLYDSTSAYSILYHDKAEGLLFAGRRDRDLQCFSWRNNALQHHYDTLAGYSPICFYKRGEWLWIGTDNGLIKYHVRQRRVVRRFTTQDGLPDNSILNLLPDADGDVWISTNHGLAIFDRTEHFTVLPETLNIEFMSQAAYRAANDQLYFGSTTGLYVVHPNSVKRSQFPPIRFVQLLINDQPSDASCPTIDEVDTLQVAYNQNNISIQVATLDYLSTLPTQYQHRLLGQSDKWIQNDDDPQIRYTNLPPGWYQLQVRALASNGKWQSSRVVIIRVDQPFWGRWWFLFLTGAAMIYSGYWLTRLYIQRKQQIQQRLTSQLLAAQESERRRIAQDLHDDVGNTLAAAKGALSRLEQPAPGQGLPALKKVDYLIEKAAHDLRAISHNLMPVEFERYTLPVVIRQAVQQANTAVLQFEYVQMGEEYTFSSEHSLVIYRIISELITNIIKHSGAQIATVQLLYQPQNLVITVEDNGHGFTSAGAQGDGSGIGLKNITSRANYIGARLDVSSNQSGTCVIVEVPYA